MAAALATGTMRAYDLLRMLSRVGSRSPLGPEILDMITLREAGHHLDDAYIARLSPTGSQHKREEP